MATDFRISTGLFSCRKLAQLERRLGRDAALGHLIRFWGEVTNSRPSGDLTGWTDEDFADAGRWDGDPSEFVRALLGCRFIDGEPGQYRVHGWDEHQPWVVGAEKRSEQGRAAAKARWERKYGFKQESPGKPDIPDAQSIDEQCCLHQSAMLNHADSNAPILSYPFLSSPSLSSPTLPEKISCIPYGIHSSPPAADDGGERKKKPDNCPYDKILDSFHRICPDLPRCENLGKTVQAKIKARWRTGPEMQNLAWWEAYFERVSESDFLCGRKTDFRAALSWLVGPINMDKVLSGQYDNHYARHIDKNMLAQARESEEFMRIMEAREAERNGNG